MKVVSLKTDGFKNLRNIDLKFDEALNVISGENAQGKTNLLEAIWLCTGLKSFRSTRDRDFIGIKKDAFETLLCFEDAFRRQTIRLCMSKQGTKDKQAFLNGVEQKYISKLFGSLYCVIFTPEDLELSKGSPEGRRRFLDLSVSMIKKSYVGVINKYADIIEQRNRLLKNIAAGSSSREELYVWNEQLSKLGSYISVMRKAYSVKLGAAAAKLYREITGGREELALKYSSTIYDSIDEKADYLGEMKDRYFEVLNQSEAEDIKAGFSTKGVHRDELMIYIDGLPSREFGSQGQNRSAALILKLAQAYILKDELSDAPVILLDDVLSELDVKRQSFILSKIKDMQVFITCCETSGEVFKGARGKKFSISAGEATECTFT